MSSRILVINSGSSSLKYQLIDLPAGAVVTKGLLERVDDHRAAISAMLDELVAAGIDTADITAVGHRVVHGGSRFAHSVLVTPDTVTAIEALIPLAPLHNPANLLGITAMMAALPSIPNVAVFDTAFHASMPAHAYTYALDHDVATRYGIRRYGFHGTSHRYVSRRAAEMLGIAPDAINVIVCHLGNGASVTAVSHGRSVDTSMGLTPLEGLVMGTRSGDIDPGVVFHLAREAGLDIGELDALLNRRSGMLGLTGQSDMREVWAQIEQGDANARTAMDVYCYRLRKYIAAYYGVVPGLHAVVFTAGAGENDAALRAETIRPLAHLGLTIDDAANANRAAGDRCIDSGTGAVRVMVIATNEELEIARDTQELLA